MIPPRVPSRCSIRSAQIVSRPERLRKKGGDGPEESSGSWWSARGGSRRKQAAEGKTPATWFWIKILVTLSVSRSDRHRYARGEAWPH